MKPLYFLKMYPIFQGIQQSVKARVMENLVANHQATIVDITVENFQQVIVEASQEKLVLIDFWADWCEP